MNDKSLASADIESSSLVSANISFMIKYQFSSCSDAQPLPFMAQSVMLFHCFYTFFSFGTAVCRCS